jgi:hypothetical protein
VALARATEDDARLAARETARSVAGALTSLATDLECADRAPTGPQRALLETEARRLTESDAHP